MTEWIKRRTAQKLETGQYPKGRFDPWSECALERPAASIAPGGQQRRRQVILDLEVTLEFVAQPLLEASARMQPRHFVLVLVGHQLEQRAGDRPRELLRARQSPVLVGPDSVDRGLIARGIAGALIGGEELGAARDDLIERLLRLWRSQQRHREIGGGDGQPSAGECPLIV